MDNPHAVNAAELLAEYRARLEEIPSMEKLQAWRPRGIEEAIERTRLIGERKALERLIAARENAPTRG